MSEGEEFSPHIFDLFFRRLEQKAELLEELGEDAIEADAQAMYGPQKKSERIARNEHTITPEQLLALQSKIDYTRAHLFSHGQHGQSLQPYEDYLASRSASELEDYFEFEPDDEVLHFVEGGADRESLHHQVGNLGFYGYLLELDGSTIDDRVEFQFIAGFDQSYAFRLSFFTEDRGVARYQIWKRPLMEMTPDEFNAINFMCDAYMQPEKSEN